MKLSTPFEIDINQLMIDGLTAMIDQISNRNEACLIEVISKASRHDSSIAIIEHMFQGRLIELFKLLSFH